MKRFASCATLLLLVVLFAPASGRASSSAASCAQPGCVFLPIVLRPPPIAVTDIWHSFARGTDSFIRFGGSVVTTANQAVSDATIEMLLYDATNQLLGTWTGTTVLTTTLVGQENPFDIWTDYSANNVHGPLRVEGRVVSWSLTNPLNYRALTVLNIVTALNGSGVGVRADLRNDSGVPLTNVQAVVWGDKQPQSIRPQPVTAYLAPGATITLATELLQYSGSNVHVTAQGTPAP